MKQSFICVIMVLVAGCSFIKQAGLDDVEERIENLEAANYALKKEIDFLHERISILESNCVEPEPEISLSIEDQIREIATARGFPYAETLIKLARCESSLNPNAHNSKGENSWGLFQINLYTHSNISKEQACDPVFAINWAIDNWASANSLWKRCCRKIKCSR